jgi:hypothetical protein
MYLLRVCQATRQRLTVTTVSDAIQHTTEVTIPVLNVNGPSD